jgi:hypothetical protein
VPGLLVLLVSTMLVAGMTTPVHAGEPPHFHKARWGMSEAQVRELAGEPIYEGWPNGLRVLAYRGELAGISCYISYIFADNELVRGRYVFDQGYSDDNQNQYITDFEAIRSLLGGQLGEPEEEIEWRSDLLRGDPSQWGMAVKAGHLSMTYTWDTKHTKVTAALTGGDMTISTTVDYAYRIKPRQQPFTPPPE